jgi:hypothetical protein
MLCAFAIISLQWSRTLVSAESLPFAICHLPFAICHLPFAIRHLPFAICHLRASMGPRPCSLGIADEVYEANALLRGTGLALPQVADSVV